LPTYRFARVLSPKSETKETVARRAGMWGWRNSCIVHQIWEGWKHSLWSVTGHVLSPPTLLGMPA
jgi:hypothetical protein